MWKLEPGQADFIQSLTFVKCDLDIEGTPLHQGEHLYQVLLNSLRQC